MKSPIIYHGIIGNSPNRIHSIANETKGIVIVGGDSLISLVYGFLDGLTNIVV